MYGKFCDVYAPKNEVKTRLVKSKCMADMLV